MFKMAVILWDGICSFSDKICSIEGSPLVYLDCFSDRNVDHRNVQIILQKIQGSSKFMQI